MHSPGGTVSAPVAALEDGLWLMLPGPQWPGHYRCMSGDAGVPSQGCPPVMAAGVRLRAAGPGDAAGLLALKRALDQETRFMLLEPGERAEGPGDVAADLDHVARGGNSVVFGG